MLLRKRILMLSAVVLVGVGCGQSSSSTLPNALGSSALTGDPVTESAELPAEILQPNAVYPIEVSIEGNVELQAAALAAEERSKKLDEVCKHLPLAASVAESAPVGGGCPRLIAPVGEAAGVE